MRSAIVLAILAIKVPTDKHCCVFVETVMRNRYGAPVDGVAREHWRIIYDGPEPDVTRWGPVDAAVRAEIGSLTMAGVAADWRPTPGRWYIVQRWRGETGHTFLWYAITEDHGELIDSTERDGPDIAIYDRRVVFTGEYRAAVLSRIQVDAHTIG